VHAYRQLTEPPGPSRAVLADRRPLPGELVLAGTRPASSMWAALDGAAILLGAAAGLAAAALLDVPPAVLATLGGVVVLAVVVVDLLRSGRTLGHRVLGVRTVDPTSGLPATIARLAHARTMDIRRGRDPIRLAPSTGELAPNQGDQWRFTASRALDAPVILTLDNGMAFSLAGPTVIGRNPAQVEGSSHLLQLPDLTRTVSKSHALLEPQGGMLWVTDLGSMNGTAVAEDGGELEPLTAHVRTVVRLGATIEFGDRLATIGSAARQPAAAGEAR
jgi:hypothetical protein